jgi:hypothetical protein
MENPRDEFKHVNELSPDLAGCNLARLYFWHFFGRGYSGDILEIYLSDTLGIIYPV